MKKNQVVDGYITMTYNFKETFPSDWDDDQIIEWIKKNYENYIGDDGELDDIDITNVEIDNYGSDDLYGI